MLRLWRSAMFVLAVLCSILISTTTSAAETVVETNGVDIVGTGVFEPMLLLPAALGLLGALLLWRWLLPSSLANLQVAF